MDLERVLPAVTSRPLFDADRTRAIEQRAQATLPAHTLMQRAGLATARLAMALAPHADRVWVAAGPGNNGGDGFEAASHLAAWGRQVRVTTIGDMNALPADAQASRARAVAAGAHIDSTPPADDEAPELAIDALLGIGASRPPEGAMAGLIRRFNALPCLRLAIDLPSGLRADTGTRLGENCIEADHTLAMLTLKPGLFTASGRDHAGTVWRGPPSTSTTASTRRPPG